MIYLANDNSNCIQHHGVLGMKWGHHRYKVNMRKAKNARQAAKEWDEIAAAERERGKKDHQVIILLIRKTFSCS